MRIADARRADGLSPALAAAASLLTLLLAVLLSGCASTTEPKPTLTPTATDAAPVFASDEEALAAATEAYRAYLVVSDLFGSGTLSGPQRSQLGSLLEITEGGKHPIELPGGEIRRFLEDGDEIILRARCAREGFASIGFGECRGKVVAAL